MSRPLLQNSLQPKPRTRSLLPTSLEKNLSTYAMAAGSAGVALLAFVQPAEAKIVFTKIDIVVPVNGGVVQFDINGDGQNDFGLSAIHFGVSTCTFTQGVRRRTKRRNTLPLGCGAETSILKVVPAQAANQVWQAGTSSTGAYPHKCAADVFAGRRIGPLRPFGAGALVMAGYSGSSIGFDFCPWRGTHKPFLGVKFLDSGGNVHYGWVRVSVSGPRNATIQGYAYETSPNTPILAGQTSGADAEASLFNPSTDFTTPTLEPASLGRLAEGATGLSAWRREEEVVAS